MGKKYTTLSLEGQFIQHHQQKILFHKKHLGQDTNWTESSKEKLFSKKPGPQCTEVFMIQIYMGQTGKISMTDTFHGLSMQRTQEILTT